MTIVADPRGVYDSISKSDLILTADMQVTYSKHTRSRRTVTCMRHINHIYVNIIYVLTQRKVWRQNHEMRLL